jgi:NAD(P)-dependent dehydrogenase (short-subunit alcohol dehydrogenase family)
MPARDARRWQRPRRGTGRRAVDAWQTVLDVAAPASVPRASRARPVDILVNNAGQAASAPFANRRRAVAAHAGREPDRHLPLHPGRAARHAGAGWGRIVNVASTAGLTGYRYVAAYCAAKHGVIGLTRALALEAGTKGVTVNAVCPGYTETDIVRDAVANIVPRPAAANRRAPNWRRQSAAAPGAAGGSGACRGLAVHAGNAP